MAVLKIYKLGEEILRKKCEPVDPAAIDDKMRELFDDMFETMMSANGVGLAAPQVGITQRFFVAMSDDEVKRVFINPQILSTSEEVGEYEEGCLSIPGFSENIRRPLKVTVQALDENGKRFTLDADGLLARIIQHENDHLDGIVYIDRGDPEFAAKTAAQCQKRLERSKQKEAEKARKAASIAAKLAAKAAKKNPKA